MYAGRVEPRGDLVVAADQKPWARTGVPELKSITVQPLAEGGFPSSGFIEPVLSFFFSSTHLEKLASGNWHLASARYGSHSLAWTSVCMRQGFKERPREGRRGGEEQLMMRSPWIRRHFACYQGGRRDFGFIEMSLFSVRVRRLVGSVKL